jgi:hypothetical protein
MMVLVLVRAFGDHVTGASRLRVSESVSVSVSVHADKVRVTFRRATSHQASLCMIHSASPQASLCMMP